MTKTEKNKYIKKLYSAIEKVAQAHGYNLIAPILFILIATCPV